MASASFLAILRAGRPNSELPGVMAAVALHLISRRSSAQAGEKHIDLFVSKLISSFIYMRISSRSEGYSFSHPVGSTVVALCLGCVTYFAPVVKVSADTLLTLENVTFSDLGKATGSFTLNAADQITSVDITTSAGGVFTHGTNYTNAALTSTSTGFEFFSDPQDTTELSMVATGFFPFLGTSPVSGDEFSSTIPAFRTILSGGDLVGTPTTPVPEPSTLGLLMVGSVILSLQFFFRGRLLLRRAEA
jgi:hypothetical protein